MVTLSPLPFPKMPQPGDIQLQKGELVEKNADIRVAAVKNPNQKGTYCCLRNIYQW
jgi:hypothetical protein